MSEKIMAMVAGMPITEDDVDRFIANLGARGASLANPEGKKKVLKSVIEQKLLLLDAQRNLYERETNFKAQLSALKEELLVNYAAEKAISSVSVKEDELHKYYEENKDKFTRPETVNASHILVDTEDEAKTIYEKITVGSVSFEDAAKEYSSCPSKENGGNLGEFERGQMVPEFDEAVFAMNVGEITCVPVKTQFGYHLIKLNAKNDAKNMPYEAVKEELHRALLNEKRRTAFDSKINQLKILYPVDVMSL